MQSQVKELSYPYQKLNQKSRELLLVYQFIILHKLTFDDIQAQDNGIVGYFIRQICSVRGQNLQQICFQLQQLEKLKNEDASGSLIYRLFVQAVNESDFRRAIFLSQIVIFALINSEYSKVFEQQLKEVSVLQEPKEQSISFEAFTEMKSFVLRLDKCFKQIFAQVSEFDPILRLVEEMYVSEFLQIYCHDSAVVTVADVDVALQYIIQGLRLSKGEMIDAFVKYTLQKISFGDFSDVGTLLLIFKYLEEFKLGYDYSEIILTALKPFVDNIFQFVGNQFAQFDQLLCILRCGFISSQKSQNIEFQKVLEQMIVNCIRNSNSKLLSEAGTQKFVLDDQILFLSYQNRLFCNQFQPSFMQFYQSQLKIVPDTLQNFLFSIESPPNKSSLEKYHIPGTSTEQFTSIEENSTDFAVTVSPQTTFIGSFLCLLQIIIQKDKFYETIQDTSLTSTQLKIQRLIQQLANDFVSSYKDSYVFLNHQLVQNMVSPLLLQKIDLDFTHINNHLSQFQSSVTHADIFSDSVKNIQSLFQVKKNSFDEQLINELNKTYAIQELCIKQNLSNNVFCHLISSYSKFFQGFGQLFVRERNEIVIRGIKLKDLQNDATRIDDQFEFNMNFATQSDSELKQQLDQFLVIDRQNLNDNFALNLPDDQKLCTIGQLYAEVLHAQLLVNSLQNLKPQIEQHLVIFKSAREQICAKDDYFVPILKPRALKQDTKSYTLDVDPSQPIKESVNSVETVIQGIFTNLRSKVLQFFFPLFQFSQRLGFEIFETELQKLLRFATSGFHPLLKASFLRAVCEPIAQLFQLFMLQSTNGKIEVEKVRNNVEQIQVIFLNLDDSGYQIFQHAEALDRLLESEPNLLQEEKKTFIKIKASQMDRKQIINKSDLQLAFRKVEKLLSLHSTETEKLKLKLLVNEELLQLFGNDCKLVDICDQLAIVRVLFSRKADKSMKKWFMKEVFRQ